MPLFGMIARFNHFLVMIKLILITYIHLIEWGTALPVSLGLLFLALVKVNSETVTPYLSFGGKNLTNHSYVDFFSTTHGYSVQCRSKLQNCCNSTQGGWVFPNGESLTSNISYYGVYQYHTTRRVVLA